MALIKNLKYTGLEIKEPAFKEITDKEVGFVKIYYKGVI